MGRLTSVGRINFNGRELHLAMIRYTNYEGADINIGSYLHNLKLHVLNLNSWFESKDMFE